MANVLQDYDPLIYAQEALEQLEKVLGMAFFVHRDYDDEARQRGSTISIRRPGTFTSASMPISSATDLAPEQVQITLNTWEGVVFALTDKELAFTDQLIIDEHLRPAAVAIADSIDQDLAGLYVDIPWYVDASDPGAVTDFTSTKQVMFGNKVPLRNRGFMIDGEREADYSALEIFHSAEKSSDSGLTQREGVLGRKFGFDIFVNQNVQTHTPGTLVSAADVVGVVDGDQVKGSTTLVADGFTASKTLLKGDIVTVAGHTQQYVLTANASVVADEYTMTIAPGLEAAVTNDVEVVTVRSNASSTWTENLAFYRNAFALAMAPLSDIGNNAGARMGVASDPITSLALRSRIWYEGKEAAVYVGLDALWGVKTLNENMACRLNV